MRLIILTLLISFPVVAQQDSIEAVLNGFHQAASESDSGEYFGYFAESAIFLGTDPTERWELEGFIAYAKPWLDKGQGWTYIPISRNIYLSDEGSTAWFDEVLGNDYYGVTRGSGVLVLVGGEWKIAQYNLSIPIPNDVTDEVLELLNAE